MNRGYYRNGLKSMRDRLLKERRLLMARYARMERMGHPDKNDQGILIDLNKAMLDVVEGAQRVCDALTPATPPSS
jgi:hypothetical protein